MKKLNILIVGLNTVDCSAMGVPVLEHNVQIAENSDSGFLIVMRGGIDVVVTNNVSFTKTLRSFMGSPPIIILIKRWTVEPKPHGADVFLAFPAKINGTDILSDLVTKKMSRHSESA